MTHKQKAFIKELPKNQYNFSKTMKKVGYSNDTSISGTQYRRLRRITKDFFDPEEIKKDARQVWKIAKKSNDVTNMQRNVEHRSKVAGMIVDKSETDNKNPEKLIIVYTKDKPISDEVKDASVSTASG